MDNLEHRESLKLGLTTKRNLEGLIVYYQSGISIQRGEGEAFHVVHQ